MVYRSYSRCTSYIDVLEDKQALSAWKLRKAIVGAALDPELVAEALQHDPSTVAGRIALDNLAEDLLELAGANDARRKGSELHNATEVADGAKKGSIQVEDVADIGAYMASTLDMDVIHAERRLVIDQLKVTGRTDRINFHHGKTPDGEPAGKIIVDVKSGRIDLGAKKMCMQLAMYSRGLLYNPENGERTEIEGLNQKWGMILHLPPGSGECTPYWADLKFGWESITLVGQVRSWRSSKSGMLIPA